MMLTARSTSAAPAPASFRSGKSAPVTMAFTPGMVSASLVSIDTMRAWAWGERSTAPSNCPGSIMSAPKRALPVTFS